MPIRFAYEVPSGTEAGQTRTVDYTHRLNPDSVQWNYELRTNPIDTYGGQVIQVLGVHIDKLIIEGQLGFEGPFGKKKNSKGKWDRRYGNDQYSYEAMSGRNFVGIYGMVEFFREYFAISTQGGDSQAAGRYKQIPMSVTYNLSAGSRYDMGRRWQASNPPKRVWQVVPTSFPSFKRSVEDFAPKWRLECEVWQVDKEVEKRQKQAAIDRLRANIGYKVPNKWSGPESFTMEDYATLQEALVTDFKEMLPNYTPEQLWEMVFNNVSLPAIPAPKGSKDALETPEDWGRKEDRPGPN